MRAISILLITALVGCNWQAGEDAHAQALAKFHFISDLCTGEGRANDPFDCSAQTDATIDGTGSAGSPFSVAEAIGGMTFGIFGDGYMGDCHITVDTSQVGDLYCHDLTIDAGHWLYMTNYRLFVSGTLYLNGAVGTWGISGNNAINGTSAVAACSSATAGNPGADTITAMGRAGGAGQATPGAGTGGSNMLTSTDSSGLGGASSTTTGNNGTTATTQHRGGGGASGGGFASAASTAGGTGGATTAVSGVAKRGPYGDVWWGLRGRAQRIASPGTFTPATGGGGGSCGKATVQPTHKVPGGGGGGAGGSWTMVAARKVVYGTAVVNGWPGQFWTFGGSGGNGGSCGTHDGDASGGGGGGGGGGGISFIVVGDSASIPSNSQNVISGGIGGTGGTGCVGGPNGGNGGNGADGRRIVYQVAL